MGLTFLGIHIVVSPPALRAALLILSRKNNVNSFMHARCILLHRMQAKDGVLDSALLSVNWK